MLRATPSCQILTCHGLGAGQPANTARFTCDGLGANLGMPSWAAAPAACSSNDNWWDKTCRLFRFETHTLFPTKATKNTRGLKGRARTACEEARRRLKRPWLVPPTAGQSGKEDQAPLALAPQSERRVARNHTFQWRARQAASLTPKLFETRARPFSKPP